MAGVRFEVDEIDFQSMASLGRFFQLGDLYDNYQDKILSETRLWDAAPLAKATQVNDNFNINISSYSDRISANRKWEHMNIDKHLQVSVMSGFFDKYNGASNYVLDSSRATMALVCRVKCKEERLDLPTLISNQQRIPFFLKDRRENEQATHVVVGVSYGAEIYCVFSDDFNKEEESRKSHQENYLLLQFVNKWKESLAANQSLVEFRKKFGNDELQQLRHLKCQFYADLQMDSINEVNVFEAYHQSLIVVNKVENSTEDFNNNMSIPISVLLCPLNAIRNPNKPMSDCHDVDAYQVSRCIRVWDKLEKIRLKADALCSAFKMENRTRLHRFVIAIGKYQQLLKKTLREEVVEERKTGNNGKIAAVGDVAEKHILFRPTRLKRWLYYEEAELEMTEKMLASVDGISFVADGGENPRLLTDKRYVLIVLVPGLNSMKYDVLWTMENYVEAEEFEALDLDADEDLDEDGETTEDEEERDGIAFHYVEYKKKVLQAKIEELVQHIRRNKGIENQVQFFIAHDRDKGSKCSYLLYDYSDKENPKKTYFFKFPAPPENVRIQIETNDKTRRSRKTSLFIHVEWDYNQSHSYPCKFWVEYRSQGSTDPWTREETKAGETNLTISVDPEFITDIRVAAESVIGVSEYSEIIDSSVFRKPVNLQQPPTGLKTGLVTQTTAEIEWAPIPNNFKIPPFYFFRIRYWKSEQLFSTAQELHVKSSESSCRLEKLQPDTTYFISISIASEDSPKISSYSEVLCLKTLPRGVRFATLLANRLDKIENRGGITLYAVPLSKTYSDETVERFSFGKPCNAIPKIRKTILLVGSAGSDKTSLINGIINCNFFVDYKDSFRFQLVGNGEESQVGNQQTSRITVYDIHHYEGFRFNGSLTIIDTPEYHEDSTKNQEITNKIRQFFEDKFDVQEINAIGLVMKTSHPTAAEKLIFESIVSIFGNGVKDNFVYLFTNQQDSGTDLPLPKVDGSGEIGHLNFDCSSFCWNKLLPNADKNKTCSGPQQDLNHISYLWDMNTKNWISFMESVWRMKSILSSTLLLDEEKRLNSTIFSLERLINMDLMKIEELRTVRLAISKHEEQMASVVDAGFHLKVVVSQKTELPQGQCATNCTQCNITCHGPYDSPSETANCDDVMDHSKSINTRTCLVCNANCMWNVHASESFKWECKQLTKLTSTEAIRQTYDISLKRKLSVEDLVQELASEIKLKERAILDRFLVVVKCNKRLDEMANRADGSLTLLQYINTKIIDEKSSGMDDTRERVTILKNIRSLCAINSLHFI